MSEFLGLDIGSNSIGWAYMDLTRTEKRALRRKHQRELIFRNKKSKKSITLLKIKSLLINNLNIFLLASLTLILFLFSIIFTEFWQFFLNLGIGGLIVILTLDKKNDK